MQNALFCSFSLWTFVESHLVMGEKKSGLSESFITGVIALVFLIVGYQTALLIHNAAVVKIAADRDEPDTVYICRNLQEGPLHPVPASDHKAKSGVRKNSSHSPRVESVRKNLPRKIVENFHFDPNTVSVDELCRLGFTLKQAESIQKYRSSGGRFRRKEDFRKSYVVSDSIYRRLEKYIDIPLTDLNLADSADFDALPGIGGWFAKKMIEHRKALGGYSYKEQLLEIYRFDQEKYDGLSDLITVSPEHITPYPLWSYPADSLRMHPYISNLETAKAIVLYRQNTPREEWTVDGLRDAGILTSENANKLSKCLFD